MLTVTEMQEMGITAGDGLENPAASRESPREMSASIHLPGLVSDGDSQATSEITDPKTLGSGVETMPLSVKNRTNQTIFVAIAVSSSN